MEEELERVSYEQYQKIQKLGFPIEVGHFELPYLVQVEKWLLKNYKLFIHIDLNFQTTKYICEVCKFNGMTCYIGEFDSKEDALKSALNKCIEIIQDDFNK